MANLYDLQAKSLDGKNVPMSEYRGKAILFVNVASKCGFTPQYQGLEELYRKYKDRGLEILGFPCNQFGRQEPGDADEIRKFCSLNYGVTFPLFAKIDVNGAGTHPIYQLLKREKRGFLGTQAIKWNFTKFLADRQGNILERFAPTAKPESLAKRIEQALG